MTDKSKKKKLVNYWILNKLATLQQDYFYHLEKKEINLLFRMLFVRQWMNLSFFFVYPFFVFVRRLNTMYILFMERDSKLN